MGIDILRNYLPWLEGDDMSLAENAVISRYGHLFHPTNLDNLTADEFREFLLIENNKHWKGISRHVTRLTADIERLRSTLRILLDESQPIEARLDTLFPKNGPGYIKGLGRAVATPILLVVYPDRYGVFNTISEEALRITGLFPEVDRGASFAQTYFVVNQRFLELAAQLDVSLWKLDALWWKIIVDSAEAGGIVEITTEEASTSVAFSLEQYLSDYLYEAWDSTVFGRDYELYEEGGEPAQEYTTPVGRIDLLARSPESGDWLVLELKRNRSSDQVVGQILRYMSWVKQNLAAEDEAVRGAIVLHAIDENLRYSLMSAPPEIDIFTYRVNVDIAHSPIDRL